jgi:hypothetical protein
MLVCTVDVLARQFLKLTTKHCLDRLGELRRSFLSHHIEELQATLAAMREREKEAWETYIRDWEREVARREEMKALQQHSNSTGNRRMSQRSVSFAESGVGSGRKASVVAGGGGNEGGASLYRRLSSHTIAITAPTSTPTPTPASGSVEEPVSSVSSGTPVTLPPSPVIATRHGSVLSPARRQSVAPLGQSMQAWSVPVDVPSPASPSTHSKHIASSSTADSAVSTNPAMAPCEKKTQLINILSSAKLRDVTQLVENLVQGCVLEVQLCLYEMAMTEQMENYMISELAALEHKNNKRRDSKLHDLHLHHLKEKTLSISEMWSSEAVSAMEARQQAQTVKLQGKYQERLRHRKAKFQESRLRTGDVLVGKLASLRKRYRLSPLSDMGLEKLKNICLIYQTLREEEEL